jgi:G3E family GTPase
MDDEIPMLVSQEDSDLVPELAPLTLTRQNLSRVPITLITGFLGSGKTTLLKYILHEEHGYRIAVVQNEFGEEIGLERAVAMGKRPQLIDVENNTSPLQEWLELPNGCICCTAKDNLVLALEKLVERRDRFDYIFIETTGMADPGPLAKTLWVDEELGSSVYLDAVVTLVDAKLIRFHLNGEKTQNSNMTLEPRSLEAQRQIALADVLIVNKTDLVTQDEQDDIRTEVETINGLAKIFFTQRSRVALSEIMGIRSFDGNKLHTALSHVEHDEDDHHHHESSKHSSSHSNGVNTIVIKAEGDVDNVDLAVKWFANLLWEDKLAIYRIKGELSIKDQSRRYIVQGVYDNFEVIPTDFDWSEALPTPTMGETKRSASNTQRRNTLVLIGINLDQNSLQASFTRHCLEK